MLFVVGLVVVLVVIYIYVSDYKNNYKPDYKLQCAVPSQYLYVNDYKPQLQAQLQIAVYFFITILTSNEKTHDVFHHNTDM